MTDHSRCSRYGDERARQRTSQAIASGSAEQHPDRDEKGGSEKGGAET